MYRKIPTDLMEGSHRGSALSYIAAFVMLMLFFLETKSYFSKTYVTQLCLFQTVFLLFLDLYCSLLFIIILRSIPLHSFIHSFTHHDYQTRQ